MYPASLNKAEVAPSMLWNQAVLGQVLWVVKLAQVALAAIAQHSHDGVPLPERARSFDGADTVHGRAAAHKQAVVVQQVCCHFHCLPVAALECIVHLWDTMGTSVARGAHKNCQYKPTKAFLAHENS